MTTHEAARITASTLSDLRRLHAAIVQGSGDEQEIAWDALERISAALHGGMTNVVIAVARGTALDDVESTNRPGPLSLGVQEGSL